jgi:hypothetical protein
MRPDYLGWGLCSRSASRVSVNVDGFTSLSPSSATNRNPELEMLGTLSVQQLPVHTGNSHPESLQRQNEPQPKKSGPLLEIILSQFNQVSFFTNNILTINLILSFHSFLYFQKDSQS